MKTGRSLQDWAKEIERRANAKRDFMVDTRSMEMFNGEQGPQVSLELQDSRLQLGMTENAHRQIGTHLNIPAKYYELMRKENPELLVQNVNSWLEKNPTRRLVRALDGDMRAFLSDRYRCIDNLDIAECVLPIIRRCKRRLCILTCSCERCSSSATAGIRQTAPGQARRPSCGRTGRTAAAWRRCACTLRLSAAARRNGWNFRREFCSHGPIAPCR